MFVNTRWLRDEEFEMRRFDFFVDDDVKRNETFAAFDRTAADVNVAIAGTFQKFSNYYINIKKLLLPLTVYGFLKTKFH